MRKKAVISYVGFAIKSRKIIFGVSNIIVNKDLSVVLYDKELGRSSLDKLTSYLNKNSIKGFCVDVEEFYPNKNCKALAVTDKNLASAIIKEMEDNELNE